MHEKLVQFVRKRRTALFGNLLSACTEGGADAIHDVRVASRRLNEPVRLLADDAEARRIRLALRGIRRAFQSVRDLDVMLEALTKAAGRFRGAAGDALAVVVEEMRRDRATAFTAAVRVAQGRPSFRLQERLDRLTDSAAGANALEPKVAELVDQRITGLCDQVKQLAQPAGDPHQVRIAGKRLRYALELAEYVGHAQRPAALARLKEAQEVLGDWHDEVVLAQELSARCFRHVRLLRDPALAGALLRLAALRLRSAGELLARFDELWPPLLAELDGKGAAAVVVGDGERERPTPPATVLDLSDQTR